jgi:hypothetical protein
MCGQVVRGVVKWLQIIPRLVRQGLVTIKSLLQAGRSFHSNHRIYIHQSLAEMQSFYLAFSDQNHLSLKRFQRFLGAVCQKTGKKTKYILSQHHKSEP